MSKDYIPQAPAVVTTPKKGLNEHKLDLPGRMRGGAVVELQMLELGETRWRLRTPSGHEARITEATLPHTQETRSRKMPGLYIMEKGWVACFSFKPRFSLKSPRHELSLVMAFAGSEEFYLHVPAEIDYVVRFSGSAVFTFASPDTTPSTPAKDELYEVASAFSDEHILALYAAQNCVSLPDLTRLVNASKAT